MCGVYNPLHLASKLKKEYSNSFNPFWALVAFYRVKYTFTLFHDILISYSYRFTLIKRFDALWSLYTDDAVLNEVLKTLPLLRNFRIVTSFKSAEFFLPRMKATCEERDRRILLGDNRGG
jgi:hypothetical protein